MTGESVETGRLADTGSTRLHSAVEKGLPVGADQAMRWCPRSNPRGSPPHIYSRTPVRLRLAHCPVSIGRSWLTGPCPSRGIRNPRDCSRCSAIGFGCGDRDSTAADSTAFLAPVTDARSAGSYCAPLRRRTLSEGYGSCPTMGHDVAFRTRLPSMAMRCTVPMGAGGSCPSSRRATRVPRGSSSDRPGTGPPVPHLPPGDLPTA